MDQRKEDPRMYIISGCFLLCIISGGVLIGLYMLLPGKFSGSCYAIIGFILISIPWIFWFLAYIYKYCEPPDDECQIHGGSSKYIVSRVSTPRGSSSRVNTFTTTTTTMMTATTVSGHESSGRYSNSGRHVHFGEVIVIGNEENGNINDIENGQNASDQEIREEHLDTINENLGECDSNISSNSSRANSVGHREIAMPLTYIAGCR